MTAPVIFFLYLSWIGPTTKIYLRSKYEQLESSIKGGTSPFSPAELGLQNIGQVLSLVPDPFSSKRRKPSMVRKGRIVVEALLSSQCESDTAGMTAPTSGQRKETGQ